LVRSTSSSELPSDIVAKRLCYASGMVPRTPGWLLALIYHRPWSFSSQLCRTFLWPIYLG
jgi:hypothetical protein